MRTKHPLYLTLLLCSLLLAYTSVADAQKVHACLILLGNDPDQNFITSVRINEDAMIGLMEIVSRNADVHMTLMKSEPGRRGEVRNTHLVNTETRAEDFPKQLGIIKPAQVTEWVRNLKVGASDTIFVYFNGHGKMDRYGRHQLLFDKTKRLARNVLLEALQEKPCRLKLLITDTCSEVSRGTHPAGGDYLAQYGDTEAKPQFYARNLFLEHTGSLDITATSPEIRTDSDTDKAFGDAKVGGFFTYALTNALVPTADTNRDDFLSWEEAFAETQAGTKQLCENHPLVKPLNIIQRPVAHTLPMRAELTKEVPDVPQTIIGQDGADMVLIPAGEFQVGKHTVHVDDFYMDKYEVTNAQYKRFVDANPRWQKGRIERRFTEHYYGYDEPSYLTEWEGNNYPKGRGNYPVTSVSWYAAMAYAEWADKRLPTEAEWQKAAQGHLVGKTYPWGDSIDSNKANYGKNVGDVTPVGSYPPNGYGLYDMAGNVREWCLDLCYVPNDEVNPGASPSYETSLSNHSQRKNPLISFNGLDYLLNHYTKVPSGPKRVLRGGCYSDRARHVEIDYREIRVLNTSSRGCSFRCVKPVTP